MSSFSALPIESGVCKWCRDSRPYSVFEGAALCQNCYKKAIWAAQNPRLCNDCSLLLTSEEAIRELFSEYGHKHLQVDRLAESAESGCGLCRMFLLQDPNDDFARLQHIPLYLFAARRKGREPEQDSKFLSAGNINSFYFSSEPDQFRLDMSIFALHGR
jgi:hypothetical protein